MVTFLRKSAWAVFVLGLLVALLDGLGSNGSHSLSAAWEAVGATLVAILFAALARIIECLEAIAVFTAKEKP